MTNKKRLIYVRPDIMVAELHVTSQLLTTSHQVTTNRENYSDGGDYTWED